MNDAKYKDGAGYDIAARLTVDLSKLAVDDYVTVRCRILKVEDPTADAMPITIDPNPWAYEIIAHEPAEDP